VIGVLSSSSSLESGVSAVCPERDGPFGGWGTVKHLISD
jgi:hypothetical protein